VRRALLSLVPLALAAASCRAKPVTKDECDRLLDRYTEGLVRANSPKASGQEIEHGLAEARQNASSSKPFQSCTKDVTREEMDCALAAWGPDAIERCLVPMP
jgi:hypothetical protein